MAPAKLRWLITERRYKMWNSRLDEWEDRCITGQPILQQLTDEGWVTIPTVIEVIDDDVD